MTRPRHKLYERIHAARAATETWQFGQRLVCRISSPEVVRQAIIRRELILSVEPDGILLTVRSHSDEGRLLTSGAGIVLDRSQTLQLASALNACVKLPQTS